MIFNYLDYALLITVLQYCKEMLIGRSKSKPDLTIRLHWIYVNLREYVRMFSFDQTSLIFFFFVQSTLSQHVKARNSFREAEPYDNDWISDIPRHPFISLYIRLNIRILYTFVPRLNVLWSNLDVSKMQDVRFRICIIIFIKYNYYWLYYYNGIILLTYIRRNTYGFNEILS